MNRLQKRNSKKGSFLVEVLLTVVILSTSLTVIIQSFLSSLNATMLSAQYSKAIILMENKLFSVFNIPSSELWLKDEGRFDNPDDKYKYILESEDLDEMEDFKDVHRINFSVSWTLSGKSKNLYVDSYHFFPIENENK